MGAIIHSLNWADYVIILVIGVSTIVSLVRGFIREFLSLISWVVAFIVAFEFCEPLGNIFSSYTDNTSLRTAIGFAILFFVTMLIGALLSYLVNVLVTKGALSLINRTLGMVFGFARGVLVVGVVLLIISMGSSSHSTWWNNSYLVPEFKGLIKWMQSLLPEKFAEASSAQEMGSSAASAITPE